MHFMHISDISWYLLFASWKGCILPQGPNVSLLIDGYFMGDGSP